MVWNNSNILTRWENEVEPSRYIGWSIKLADLSLFRNILFPSQLLCRWSYILQNKWCRKKNSESSEMVHYAVCRFLCWLSAVSSPYLMFEMHNGKSIINNNVNVNSVNPLLDNCHGLTSFASYSKLIHFLSWGVWTRITFFFFDKMYNKSINFRPLGPPL